MNGFGAVILAGGKSSRMGRDKAFLELDGQPLLARQIALARQAGAQEVLIAGRPDVDYAMFACPVVRDRLPSAGPLAGIESALNATRMPLLLVLAVDLPHMTASLLRELAARCTASLGVVPCVGGELEPLATYYPKASLSAAARLLDSSLGGPRTKFPSAKAFAERCIADGLVRTVDLPAADSCCFTNWNSPADLPWKT